MTTTITLTFRFPMGHRILGLTGDGAKCRNIHGHNWTADIEWPVHQNRIDLEFGQVKKTVGDWIETHLDHGFAVASNDIFRRYLYDNDCKHIVLDGPPTTEAIAELIGTNAAQLVGRTPTRVHLVEGYRNAATWTPA